MPTILMYIQGIRVIYALCPICGRERKKVLTAGAGFLQILAPGGLVCHYEKPKEGQGRVKIGSRIERHRVRFVPRCAGLNEKQGAVRQ